MHQGIGFRRSFAPAQGIRRNPLVMTVMSINRLRIVTSLAPKLQ